MQYGNMNVSKTFYITTIIGNLEFFILQSADMNMYVFVWMCVYIWVCMAVCLKTVYKYNYCEE